MEHKPHNEKLSGVPGEHSLIIMFPSAAITNHYSKSKAKKKVNRAVSHMSLLLTDFS